MKISKLSFTLAQWALLASISTAAQAGAPRILDGTLLEAQDEINFNVNRGNRMTEITSQFRGRPYNGGQNQTACEVKVDTPAQTRPSLREGRQLRTRWNRGGVFGSPRLELLDPRTNEVVATVVCAAVITGYNVSDFEPYAPEELSAAHLEQALGLRMIDDRIRRREISFRPGEEPAREEAPPAGEEGSTEVAI